MMTGQTIAVVILFAWLIFWSVSLMVHRSPKYALAVWLGWGIPGLGHMILGRPIKGALFFILLGAMYTMGMAMISWNAITYEDQPFYYIGQYGSGITWLMTAVLGSVPHPHEGWPVAWYDPGLLYVAAPGLLNLVIVLNLFQPRVVEKPKPEAEPKAEAKEKPAP